jgi:hypothetical protein
MYRKQRLKIIITSILTSAFVIVGLLQFGSNTQAAAAPELPRVYIDSTYPILAASRTTWAVKSSCTSVPNCSTSLQTAIDQASPGDEIIIDAGLTITGPITLKNKSGNAWIVIRTSNMGSLPPPGTRVNPTLAQYMAKIVSPGANQNALNAEDGAHNYRLVGLEFAKLNSSVTVTNLVYIGDTASTSVSQLPHDIIFDRVYAHGPNDSNMRRCIGLNTGAAAVIDSYLSNCHEIGADSQAIASWNGTGPFKFVNNYLEGAGENILFGGSDPHIQNLTAADIEIRNNYFYKPLSWKVSDPSYAGFHWTIKNLFEFKNARRALIDGNIFENSWTDAQTGIGILFKSANQDGGCTWCVSEDITFSNNIVKNVLQGMTLNAAETGSAGLPLPQLANTIAIKNNLFLNVSGRLFYVNGGVSDVTMDHNTAVTGNTIMLGSDSGTQNPNFAYTNNIMSRTDYGIGTGSDEGKPTFDKKFTPYSYSKNLIVNESTDNTSNTTFLNRYPTGTFVDNLNNVGFVNASSGNYQLSSGSYKNAGTDGKDLGVDFNALNSATATSISGSTSGATPPPPPPAVGPFTDTVDPVVNSFTISPSTVAAGVSFSPTFSSTDTGGSFLASAELWAAAYNSTNCSDTNKSGCFWLQRATKTAPTNVNSWNSNFTDSRTAGIYYYGVHVNDKAGNSGTETSLVKLTVTGTGTAVVGDINIDHIVNSLDYSILNAKWLTSDASSDLNADNIVNSLDFSILNGNWFKTW